MLGFAPRLVIMSTSRALLRLAGEHVYPVAPLALPDSACPPAPGALARVAAVALFLARARARVPDFQITGANAQEVAEICTRLDGLPLAIELAAARTAVLSPRVLLERLDHRLALLTDGPRDLPERQRTLRATIAWSYDLLDGRERLLLERLTAFAGGWTLEAAEAVCPGTGAEAEVPIGLHALIDKNLIQRVCTTGALRFTMLETIREYALERLTERGEVVEAQRAHAAYFLRFAEHAASFVQGPDQVAWLDALDGELANLRLALAWLLESDMATEARRLAWALHWFWHVRGHLSEGRGWLDRALASVGGTSRTGDEAARRDGARLRYAAGLLAVVQGDLAAAQAHLETSVELWRALVETPGGEHEARRYLVRSLCQLLRTLGVRGDASVAMSAREAHALAGALGDGYASAEMAFGYARGLLSSFGDVALARRLLLEAQATFHEQGDIWYLAQVRNDLGMLALLDGDFPGARRNLREALGTAHGLKDLALEAQACNNLGEVARHAGDDGEAASHYGRSLRLCREMDARTEVPRLVHNLGYLALRAGDLDRARAQFTESLALFHALGQHRGMAEAIAGMAAVAARVGTPEAALRAARLWGVADAAHACSSTRAWPVDQAERSHHERLARAVARGTAYDDAYAVGAAWSLEDAIAEALRTELSG